MRKYFTYILLVLLILLLLGAWYGWNHKQEIALHYVTPAEPEVITMIETIKEECVPIVYYRKAEAEKEDLVPEYAKKDDDKQVTAAIDVPPHESETLVTSVFDMKTGINTLSYRQEPVPFRGGGFKELGIMYGIDEKVVVNGRWEPLRLGSWYLKVEGSIDSDAEAFLGAGLLRRWR